MLYQRTIKDNVDVIGVGLHSGCRVKLTLKPADADCGITFVRTDLAGNPHMKLHPLLINDTRLSSTIVGENGFRVATIEHLMSAFACLGIDNIIVELSSTEIPIMDGSSNSFLFLINQAGVIEQNVYKKYIRIKETVEIEEDGKIVRLDPFDGYKLRLKIEFDHPVFKAEFSDFEVDFAKSSYVDEISRARTFGFMYEFENMRKNGLGLGGNLHNAVVIDEENVLNVGGLRFPDEFVRHKILDAIGDLYVIGYQFIGSFYGFKSGHAINNKLLRKILNNPSCYEFVTFTDEGDVPHSFTNLD